MSFPAYPDYKDSGIAWLGDVPSHWEILPVKRATTFQTGWTPPTGRDDLYGGDNIWVTIGDLSSRVVSDSHKRVTDEAVRQIGIQPSPKNSLLFSFKLSIGQVAFAGCDLYTNEAIATFLPSRSLCLNFAFYAFPHFVVKNAAENIYGAKLLNQELIRSATLALPPREDQTVIATFLDRETAKIDALVAEQERLIALLREKRQAVISHAVTKGLNPDAPMKDSGIEWLGEIPAHWDRLQLGRLCRQVSDGPHFSPPYVDEGILFLSARNIRVDGWSFEDAKYVSEELYEEFCKRVTPEKDDVLYTKGGTTGVARVVDFDAPFQVWVHVAVLKIHRELALPEFVAHSLNSTGCYEQSQLHTRGATNQDLGLTRMIKIWLALPPIDEQRAIVADLDARLTVLDEATATASKSISLLEERRAALISAAVTGKIDVRAQASQSNIVSIGSARRSTMPPLRAVVGAYAIHALGPMGRMAVMKGGYLAEAYAGVAELGGSYQRKAAGPYCSAVIDGMERDAALSFGIQTVEPVDQNGRVTYRLPQGFARPSGPLKELIGEDRAARLIGLLDLLKDLSREGVEAIATLYAVWNDLLAAGKAADDDAICNDVLNDWHPEKAQKFTRSDLDHWLDWMRRNRLVPDGSAPRTDNQGSLFT
ncbi:restriction endonuclease subunit S [Sphingobium abikonense]|uniref:restriction endonuclease subunit S n=1 Tax=Sphingobium abikonense TaxID=86193 RepID=UPI0035173438